MRPRCEAKPWRPLLPAYAAAAVLFWSFAHPRSWAWPSGQTVTLAEGSVHVAWGGSAPTPVLNDVPILGNLFRSSPPRLTNWWFTFDFQGPAPGVAIPLWAPVLMLTLAGAAMRRRAERQGRCRACGYDLTGLRFASQTGGCCPECGAETAADGEAR